MDIKRVDLADLQSDSCMLQHLRESEPFVVPGAMSDPTAFDELSQYFQHQKIELWDQHNDFFKTFRERLSTCSDEKTCPCTTMSGVDTVSSSDLIMSSDFQVVLRHIFPMSRLDRRFVQPFVSSCLHTLDDKLIKSTHLFNSLFISRGTTRGILHAHNYDVFGSFLDAGRESVIYLFPPRFYAQFESKCMLALAGVVNVHNRVLEDDVINEAVTYKIQPGDLIHIPFCWYHRVDHTGAYVHFATSWFVPELMESKLAAVKPYFPVEDWLMVNSGTRRLRNFQMNAPIEYVAGRVRQKLSATQVPKRLENLIKRGPAARLLSSRSHLR